jgi:alpha-glucosidase
MDANGDGIGDLPGILRRLDYLADLGIDAIWLCPIFASPMVDNGYDISDYQAVHPAFGTMEDLDRLIQEADRRGIRIFLDLVLNHSSDQHPWFKRALSDPGPYRDFYLFRQGTGDGPPTNWRSIFGGSVWERLEDSDTYYFHTFAKEQPDLNWENPALRRELYRMIHWWIDKGIRGFRIDAITYIKKDQRFPNLPPDGSDGLADCAPCCRVHPGIEAFLAEMRDEVFKPRGIFTVAEANGLGPGHLRDFIGENGFFSTYFDFTWAEIDIEAGIWHRRRHFSRRELREAIFANQAAVIAAGGHGALYLENHDQNRSPDKYLSPRERVLEAGAEGAVRGPGALGKSLLAVLYFFLQGTPFIYQGQELGMTNHTWKSLEEFDDLSTVDQYRRARAAGFTEAEALETAAYRSRDNGRLPFLWDDSAHAAFSTVTPWLPIHRDYRSLNAAAQAADPHSLLRFYRRMIRLRKSREPLFFEGSLEPRFLDREGVFAYERRYQEERLLVVCNFSADPCPLPLPGGRILLNNYRTEGSVPPGEYALRPLEALVLESGDISS